MPPSRIVDGEHCFPVVRPASVCCLLSVRDAILSGRILMKLATNIHHVKGNWGVRDFKVRGQRSRSQQDQMHLSGRGIYSHQFTAVRPLCVRRRHTVWHRWWIVLRVWLADVDTHLHIVYCLRIKLVVGLLCAILATVQTLLICIFFLSFSCNSCTIY